MARVMSFPRIGRDDIDITRVMPLDNLPASVLPALRKMHPLPAPVQVPLTNVRACQKSVSASTLISLLKKSPATWNKRAESAACIAEVNGVKYVVDGHHRVVAALLLGRSHIEAQYVKL